MGEGQPASAAGDDRNAHGEGAQGDPWLMLDPGGHHQRGGAGQLGDGGAAMLEGGKWIAGSFARGSENQKLGLDSAHGGGEFMDALSPEGGGRENQTGG